jgi:hypothetical protein
VLVNTTHVAITKQLPWDLERWPTVTFDTAKDNVDVLIELGGQIDANATEYFERRGARLISYCCGSEYVHAMESILFNRPASTDAFSLLTPILLPKRPWQAATTRWPVARTLRQRVSNPWLRAQERSRAVSIR